jgi:hypothetical protein
MRSINIELLMGHSIGISDSYYRIPEKELLEDYLKSVDFLTIGENTILLDRLTELSEDTSRAVEEKFLKREIGRSKHRTSLKMMLLQNLQTRFSNCSMRSRSKG